MSQWDKQTENGRTPKNPQEYLEEESPALYNYIEYNINNAKIIGLSAQGREYPQNENPENYNGIKKEIRKQMQNGNRSFVEDGTSILYDLSIPLYLLLK